MLIALAIPAVLLAAQVAPRGVEAGARQAEPSQPSQPSVRPSTGPVRRVEGNASAGPLRDRLEIVDAGSEDVGPLGASLRKTAIDPRVPTAFQRVYRVPGEDDKFMRGNGALFAVFPSSVYRLTPRGLMPTTPAGTVYHIGMPGELHLAPVAPPSRALAPGQLDGRVPLEIAPSAPNGIGRIETRVGGRLPAIDSAPLGPRSRDGNSGAASDSPANAAQPARSAASMMRPEMAAEAPIAIATSGEPYAHLRFGPPRVERE